MYLSFYKLSARPFNISTDPTFLWLGEKHQEALANLRYGLLQANGYVVLTGDVGTGKTTLVNTLIDTLDANVLVAYINHPTLNTLEFFDLVAKTYGISTEISSKSEFLFSFRIFLQKSHAEGKIVLLIIDEAHCLSKELLEEIRLLSNLDQAGTKFINIFFVGQNEFQEVMQGPECRSLRQRITLFYEILPLIETETRDYVEHRLKIAGFGEQLFTPAAIGKIQKFTRGYPRLINILCDRAMLTGYIQEKKEIDVPIIKECIWELDSLAPKTAKFPTNLIDKISKWGRRPGGGLEAKQNRYKLVQGGLLVLFALGIVTLGISKYTQSPVRSDESAISDGAVVANKKEVVLSQAVPPQPQVDEELFPDGLVNEVLKDVTAIETVKQESPTLSDNEEAVEQALPVAASTPPEEEALLVESTPEERESLPQFKSPEVAAAVHPEVPEPTNLELAFAALKQNDFQMAIDLLETDQGPHGADNPEMGELYSRALAGRALQILKTSPAKGKILLLRAVEIDPNNIEAHLNLGKIYTQSKDYVLAIDAYQNVVTLNPNLSNAFFNLGFLYATTNMYEDAEIRFARVVELEPPYLDKALFNLAVIQEKLGKKEECLANLQLAMAISPDNEKFERYLRKFKGNAKESQQ